MDVLTFETCWAVNSEIIRQVTPSWSIFIQPFEYFAFRVQCREGGRSKNFSIEHVSTAESKSSHQEGQVDETARDNDFSPLKNSLWKLTKKKRANYPTRPKQRNLFGGPACGRPSCAGNKKERQNIFCAGCDEQSEEPVAEDWIQRMKCHRRWHKQCSSFERDLTFKCDSCRVCILRWSFVKCKEHRYLRVCLCQNLVFCNLSGQEYLYVTVLL